jgi:cyclic pyranopterin phosphate synthase
VTGRNTLSMKRINYLRLSVTDRCNLRCRYCRPSEKNDLLPPGEILRLEEMASAAEILTRQGIKFVRITGGEPLVRRNVEELIRMLRDNGTVEEISMTTNGVLLENRLPALLRAGLNRINISLNTFDREKYRRLTGADRLEEAVASVAEALAIPDFPVKINAVVLAGINDDEIEDFAVFSLENAVCVRFIEYFPSGSGDPALRFLPGSVVRERIEKRFGMLIPDEVGGRGPAVNYRIAGARGSVGFINTRTFNICADCNRLRLTAAGRLYPCLFAKDYLDLKRMLRENASAGEIDRSVGELIARKPLYTKGKAGDHLVAMSAMGG